ncbi:MAG: hypothetical protein BWY82_02457 [Verrucomicrobia bacterium ADurb.Bin474]|nr:MAG: hypothetical protein BWY82_02457 [Verrucomicrobia bacterium ADurb.Bin474]
MDQFPSIDQDLRPLKKPFGPRLKKEAGHAGDRRYCLPPEPEGPDIEKIIARLDLARGMPLDAHHRIIGTHPASIVLHPHERLSTLLNRNPDPGRSSINAVFDELLDDRNRTLHHLTRGNAVGHLIGKYAYRRHGSGSSQYLNSPDFGNDGSCPIFSPE